MQNRLVSLVSLAFVVGCGEEQTPAPDNSNTRPQVLECGSPLVYQSSHDVCGAMDVAGEGACLCVSMGWAWNGEACVKLDDGFCSCVGADCNKLTETVEECEAQHEPCAQHLTCGSPLLYQSSHDVCGAMDVAGEGVCNCVSMGWAWNGEACVKLDDGFCSCVGADCDKLTETVEECEAQHELCAQHLTCGSPLLYQSSHDSCNAMDVAGEGACFCVSMGWTWNGEACVQLDDGFCSCVGADCDKLTETVEECEAQHEPCAQHLTCGSPLLYQSSHDVCDAMDVAGEGACLCVSMGWTWNGEACVKLDDGFCSCVGADCDKLTETLEDCVAAHSACD
jgi:hypothetical protein